MNRTKPLTVALALAGALTLSAAPAHAAVVLDDHFDNSALGTNPSGTGGGFVENDSSGGTSGTVSESGTNVTIAETLGDADGIVSANGFDLSGGVIATWEVTSLSFASAAGTRRSFYGLQDATNSWLFGSADPGIGIRLDPVNNTAALLLRNNGASQGTATQSLLNQINESGYVITAEYTSTGYNITSTGLGAEINLSGTWDATGDFSFNALFGGGNLHASAYIQDGTTLNGTSTGSLVIDRIALNAIPTPAALPAGLALLGLAAMRRRGAAKK